MSEPVKDIASYRRELRREAREGIECAIDGVARSQRLQRLVAIDAVGCACLSLLSAGMGLMLLAFLFLVIGGLAARLLQTGASIEARWRACFDAWTALLKRMDVSPSPSQTKRLYHQSLKIH